MAIDPRSSERITPQNVARIVNLAAALQRERAELGIKSWADVPMAPIDRTERLLEQIVATLAEHAERILVAERLADYAAEKAEAA